MIIIYTEDNDITTNIVMDWLSFLYNGEIKRINTDFFQMPKSEEYFVDISESIDVKAIWYRRPGRRPLPIRTIPQDLITEKIDNKKLETLLLYSANKEIENINAHDLANTYKAKNMLGGPMKYEVNKFQVLKIAKNIGIDIPKSILTNSKSKLVDFFNECNSEIISKMHDMLLCDIYETHSTYATYTEKIELSFINNLPDYFFIGHFQEKLEKEYEIRSFYLDGEIFSMAMFSQKNKQTSVDFRRYNRDSMNRRVTYRLPSVLEDQIRMLMQKLNLNCGSIDIVKTKDRYVFLEVNPVGQFGFVTGACNYHLHKKIAEYLIQ
ncbi:grasp-with-spasm system ATP-grasp peptide maturase [Chryseobacterium carnipullorum]|uniref:Glutathione synthase/Ribosomal protein S6 modification enzyme (Glutaminyl transferase) n=1 Tax=Chryseobacterium carnipullorum TaxID=1124835 RepID=A0A376E635_CHRCU|nr:grasp-with-spasm system ATP-grasp peptide maturase [Chryseobacterium carnipullorum]AZA50819.1 grasp-with-spasm system ATP-grasp peptide maturase [Chryseobacterium carnipullorum]AZA65682.1 grasp-with-spasm system ATP-grasp peptide maturase [Chryseobacterium carnipullorum]STD02320.1 Glutathione synthase/Ribosomal protein S6 modification enzyme (glutaminyl transferase) [Chryseobacterium carnipullorum]